MNTLFGTIAAVLSIYSLLCFFRIILTWIPGMSYSRGAQFLANICDPYMNLFRGIKWLRMGSFDFSPALALCLLGALSSVFKMLANGGTVSIGMLLAMAVQVIFSIFSSLLVFVIIIFIIRLIVILFNRDSYYSGNYMMDQLDSSISPLVYRIARTFVLGKTLTYKAALIIAIIALLVINFVMNYLCGFIIQLLANLPI